MVVHVGELQSCSINHLPIVLAECIHSGYNWLTALQLADSTDIVLTVINAYLPCDSRSNVDQYQYHTNESKTTLACYGRPV